MNLEPLKQHRNWMCWQFVRNGDKVSKTPIDAKTGTLASSADPSTWASYEEAKAAVASGMAHSIGFALTREVGLVVVDFDRVTSEPGVFPQWVRREIDELDSYTEISASGTGAHVLVWATIPKNYNRQSTHIEIWGFDKMFAFSEDIWEGHTEIKSCDISDLHARIDRNAIGPDYKMKLVLERFDTPKFKDLCADNWEKHGFTSRSEVRMSILTTLASKYPDNPEAIMSAFEKTAFGQIEIDRGKWPRLAEGEIERAYKYARDKRSDEPAIVELIFRKPRVPGSSYEFIVGPKAGFKEGWFPRGDVSIIGGASGAGKSTWMNDVLEKQALGEKVEDRETFKLPYFVLLEDRGPRDLERTLDRMHINMATYPHRSRNSMLSLAQDLQELLDSVDPTPAIVYVEGLDLAVSDAKDSNSVNIVFKQIWTIADHYHCAIVGSFGSGKRSAKDQYASKRDRVIGSTTWSRKAITMVFVEKEGGKETDQVVVVSVMPRNAPAEEYRKQFDKGRLVPAAPKPAIAAEVVDETALANWAMKQTNFDNHAMYVAFPTVKEGKLRGLIKELEKKNVIKKYGKFYNYVTGGPIAN